MTFNEALPYIIAGIVVLALLIGWYLMANRTATVVSDGTRPAAKDVLDEGAAPAARNQALIDTPPAATKPVVEPAPAPTAAPAPVPTPAPAPAPASAAGAKENADDLTTIKGVGPKLVTLLAGQGITTFAQIAAWTEEDIARVDEKLGRFKGRIARDNWVEQAKLLEKGDKSGFSEKFGNNG